MEAETVAARAHEPTIRKAGLRPLWADDEVFKKALVKPLAIPITLGIRAQDGRRDWKNKNGSIAPEEQSELEDYLWFEHILIRVKVRDR